MSTPRQTRARSGGGGHPDLGRDLMSFDPSQNVKDLSDAANQRQDDLRSAAKELSDAKHWHVKEISQIREHYQGLLSDVRELHQRDLDSAESSRLNSIRQVDREDVAKQSAAAQVAITTLATTTNTMAETLRAQVATVAGVAEMRQNAFSGDVNKRISALELSFSEGKGKQQVADPQMERLAKMVEELAVSKERETGTKDGISLSWGVLLGLASLVATVITIFVFFTSRPSATNAVTTPNVIYVPSPAGTLLPTTPPMPVPR